MKHTLFESPSGRLHASSRCSGGPGPLRMVAIRVTPDELQEIWDESVSEHNDPSFVICKCAWSKVPNREVK